MNFVSVSKMVNGKKGRHPDYGRNIWVATDKSGNGDRLSMRIVVPKIVFDEARFRDGDKIDVAIDVENHLCRLSVDPSGYSMSKAASGARYTIKLSHIDGFTPKFSKYQPMQIRSIDNGSIVFSIKEDK